MSLLKIAAKFANKLEGISKLAQELTLRDGKIYVSTWAEKTKAERKLKELGLSYPVILRRPKKPKPSEIGKPRSYQDMTGQAPGSAYVGEPVKPTSATPTPAPAKPASEEFHARGYWVRLKGTEHNPSAKTWPVDYSKWQNAPADRKAKYVIVGTY